MTNNKCFVNILALFLAGAGTSACFVETNPSAVKLVGGHEPTATQFASVFIWAPEGSDLPTGYCTGTKVAPNLIITAAHCVLQQTPFPGHQYIGPWSRMPVMEAGHLLSYSFSRNIQSSTAPSMANVVALHLPPNVERCLNKRPANDSTCTWRAPVPDVALIEVSTEDSSPFSRAPIARVSYDFVEPGLSFFMMGYGSQDDGDTDPSSFKCASARVATESELDAALRGTDAETDGMPDLANNFGALGILVDPRYPNLGSGDSGGPVMLTDGVTIVGINSDGHCPLSKPDCQRASNSIFARIDSVSGQKAGRWLATHLK